MVDLDHRTFESHSIDVQNLIIILDSSTRNVGDDNVTYRWPSSSLQLHIVTNYREVETLVKETLQGLTYSVTDCLSQQEVQRAILAMRLELLFLY